MGRLLVFAYGLIVYTIFFVTFLYSMGFVNEVVVPKDINDGVTAPGSLIPSILVNAGILALFAVQHLIMARPRFKAWWTRIIPASAERSTFVLLASGILLLLFWQWRPLPAVLWDVEIPVLRVALTALSFLGFGIVLYSSFLIDHFDLFGLRQVVLHLRQRSYPGPKFMERSLYRCVRHPLMLGFLIAFWVTPTMTAGHLLFALLTTGYIVLGTWVEERDLLDALGDDYARYRKRTPAFIPRPRRPLPEGLQDDAMTTLHSGREA